MKQSLSLETRLEHTQSLHTELRIELSQKLQQSILQWRDDVVGDPEELLESVIETALSYETNDNVRTALEAVFADKGLRQRILQYGLDFIRPSKETVEHCVLKYFYGAHRGEFFLTDEQTEETRTSKPSEPLKISFAVFTQAVTDPQETKKTLQIVRETLQKKSDPDTIEHFSELNNALNIAEAAREHIELLKNALTRLLQLRDPEREDAQPLVRQFLTERSVFTRLTLTLSERMQKRFAASFARAKRGQGERLQTAFLNTVGEYTLVACGVLDPELFQLQRKSINEEEVKTLQHELANIGVDYHALCKTYALSGNKTMLWNRWKTPGMEPGPKTDERIRDFITRSVRREKDELLRAARYDDMFEEICSAKEAAEGSSAEQRAQLEDALREILANVFEESEFQKTLKTKIGTSWEPEIERMMGKK